MATQEPITTTIVAKKIKIKIKIVVEDENNYIGRFLACQRPLSQGMTRIIKHFGNKLHITTTIALPYGGKHLLKSLETKWGVVKVL